MKKKLCSSILAFAVCMESLTMPAYAASEDDLELADVQETEIREGICQAEDGNYYYYLNNEIDITRTDVVKGTVNGVSGWWCVQNGKLNYAGLCSVRG